MTDIVAKLWGFCHKLRHDGIDYGDYVEQITFLLFLKMADEKDLKLPKGCDWETLRTKNGTELLEHYQDLLRTLAKQPGLLGDVFAQSQSRFNNPVNLRQLVALIDETEWTALGVDVKAEAYEGLLEKAASEGKKGAGQYFTPRVLIQAMVRCIKPDPRAHPEFTICDPAVGTGGFLVAAREWLNQVSKGAFERDVAKRLRSSTYYGTELVARPRRLALMNLYLHNVEPHITLGDAIYNPAPAERFDVVLMNPPFGTRGANQAPEREDFTVETSNKQLNFLQHVLTILKPGGRAAVVLPDNCLFADQAGEVMKILTEDADLHTVLRLPRGTFTPYSQGVKANVIFFTKGRPTQTVWIYDARTNVPQVTKKDRPLTPGHFAEFERCYGNDPNGHAKRQLGDSRDDRWRSFTIAEVKELEFKLDGFKWLKEDNPDDADELPEPEELVTAVLAELQASVEQLRDVMRMLEGSDSEGVTLMTADSPEGWTSARLEELFDWWGGMTPSTAIEAFWGGKTPWVSSKDLKSHGVNADTEMVTDRALRETRLRKCRPGTLLTVVRSGVLAHTLPVAVTDREVVINQDLKAFDSGDDDVNHWLAVYLRAHEREILEENRKDGTTVQSIRVDQLVKREMPLPPIAEQRRIVAMAEALLARVGAVRERVTAALARAEMLPQAILSRAFAGELVPTEAELARAERRGYETAEALLQRIRSEREAVIASRRRKAPQGGSKRNGAVKR